ncbi:MAG: preprotein translocase subunit Sec61beta [archaeon]|nr:MAG: preprotein translocase subunit Sec61beta [archaeon]
MAEELKIPSSGGGLMRYSEEYDSKIRIKPEVIIGITIAIIAFELLLRVFGGAV